MKNLVVMLFAMSSASVHAGVPEAGADRIVFDKAGQRTVIRAVENVGRTNQVDQRLRVTADGRLRYDFNEQSEETKEYHRSYCEQLGMKPVIEGEILFGADASGWHCSNVHELYPDELADLQRFPLDYIHAVGPSGSVQSYTNLAC